MYKTGKKKRCRKITALSGNHIKAIFFSFPPFSGQKMRDLVCPSPILTSAFFDFKSLEAVTLAGRFSWL